MFPHHYFLVLLLITIFNGAPVICATFENVTILLRSPGSTKHVLINSDDTLQEYINPHSHDILEIESQIIPDLKENSLSNLVNIAEMNIIASGVKHIQPGTFKNLPQLYMLRISHNPLEEIKNGVFTNLNLTSLYLENNNISKLDDKAFNNMIVKYLYLNNNKITTWKSDWFAGTKIEAVSMVNNLLEELPSNSFEHFVKSKRDKGIISIEFLLFNDNKLKKLDPAVFEGIEEVVYINLANNSLQQLPQNVFQSMLSIRSLHLSDNKLTHIEGIFANTNIEHLYLQNNLLNCLPLDILNGTKIFYISVQGNPITCECLNTIDKLPNKASNKIISLEDVKSTCK